MVFLKKNGTYFLRRTQALERSGMVFEEQYSDGRNQMAPVIVADVKKRKCV